MLTLLSLLLAARAWATPLPNFAVLSAPYTPYNADGSVNVDVIPALAADFKRSGVNTVWVGGGMGHFDGLSVDERKQLFSAWVKPCQELGIYMIAHVGTTVQADAVKMAQHAAQIGCDAIAAVPPYYTHAENLQLAVDFFKPIVNAAPSLDFYYYHIPGSSGYNVEMYDFVKLAHTQLPSFKGVKYVSSDQHDFFNCVTKLEKSLVFMWAPEPKLQSFAFPGKGTVLAESFYAGTFLRMWDAYNRGDFQAARAEQQWKYDVDAIFASFNGTVAKRAIYQHTAGVNNGPSRLPLSQYQMAPHQLTNLVSQLNAKGFFNQTIPSWTPPKQTQVMV